MLAKPKGKITQENSKEYGVREQKKTETIMT